MFASFFSRCVEKFIAIRTAVMVLMVVVVVVGLVAMTFTWWGEGVVLDP